MYLTWAAEYYRKPSGRPTGEATNLEHALQPLRDLLGNRVLETLKPSDIDRVRNAMIEGGLCRSTVNSRIGRCRRFVRWSIKHEHAKPTAILPWESIDPLKYGRTRARERPPVLSARLDAIDATLPHLSELLSRMVLLQLATGMRSGELCSMRWDCIDRQDDIWIYTPAEHKTEHHGHDRKIPIPPNYQWLLDEPKPRGHVFEHHRGGPYTAQSYSRAIRRAITRARCTPWTPHQLRHNAITDWVTKGGVEAARLLAGHATCRTTAMYIDNTVERVIWASKQVSRDQFA